MYHQTLTLFKKIQKIINVSTLNSLILLSLLLACQSQSIKSENKSEIRDSSQSQSLTIFGVSPEIYGEAIKQGEEATKKLNFKAYF